MGAVSLKTALFGLHSIFNIPSFLHNPKSIKKCRQEFYKQAFSFCEVKSQSNQRFPLKLWKQSHYLSHCLPIPQLLILPDCRIFAIFHLSLNPA
jgi:hypothetical protein